MFKSIVLALSLVVAAAPCLAADTGGAGNLVSLRQAVEQCVRQNASRVESAIADLGQATDFLVQKICAQPLAEQTAFQTQQAQQEQNARLQKLCDEQKSKRSDDGGRKGLDACSMQDQSLILMFGTSAPYLPAFGNAEPDTIALAAKLLLDLRIAHQAPIK